jgi:nitrite reductase/ring-hydroxylating ferredoxin subunit
MGEAFIPVAREGELAPGAMKAVDLGGRRVLVTNVNGEHFAFGSQCPHEGTELDEAEIREYRLRCQAHSYCFDLRTGECVIPRGGPPLAVLPVVARDGELCLRLEW